MRERITFFQKLGTALDPSVVKTADHSIQGPDLDAAREDRLTFALDELPNELQALLGQTHELHIRWAAPIGYDTISPLFSRVSPGFHLFYTPGQDTAKDSPRLCSTLGRLFGKVDCSTPAESFTALANDRFSHSAAFQFFQPLDSLAPLVTYIQEEICPSTDIPSCATRALALAKAVSLDVSYDTISHALRITSLWQFQRQSFQIAAHPQHRTEVGVLASDTPPNLEPHELGISGLLTVLGPSAEPSPTIFSFPSRHRNAESGFLAKLLDPTGLHPTMQISLDSKESPAGNSSCSPHAYLTLPRNIFADKYQLADDLFLASKNLTALRYSSQPVDLEAPEYTVKLWGSAILLELSPPQSEGSPQSWTAEIPLHLRYLAPLQGGYRTIEVPYPVVFWACAAEEGTKFSNNPFDRVNLGYDGLFGPRTVFWHVEPRPAEGDRLLQSVRVPVLDLDKSEWINVGTSVVILLGFAWVVWKLLAVYLKTGVERTNRAQAATEQKKSQ